MECHVRVLLPLQQLISLYPNSQVQFMGGTQIFLHPRDGDFHFRSLFEVKKNNDPKTLQPNKDQPSS